jgi:uncharacterized membrane protein
MTSIAVSDVVIWSVAIPIVVVWILGVVDILRRGLPAGQAVLWIVVVIVLPIVGTLVYFGLRKPTEREIQASQAAAAERRR